MGVRRNSKPTEQIVELAKKNDLDIDGERLETLSQGGMIWPEGTPDDRKVEYLRQLLRLTGHRKSRDRAALIMAVHGCPTTRLRSALAGLNSGSTDAVVSAPLNVDTTNPSDHDAIADAVDRAIADAVVDYTATPLGTGTFKATTAKVLDSVARERNRSASKRIGRDELGWDDEGEDGQRIKPDSPDVFRQRVAHQILGAYVNGGDFDDSDIVDAFTNDATETDALAEMLPTLPAETSHLIETMPLDELATICRVTRDELIGSGQLPSQFSRLDNDDLDEIAATLAPLFYVHQRHLLRNVLARFDVSESMVEAALRADAYGLPISAEDRAALPPLPMEGDDSQA